MVAKVPASPRRESDGRLKAVLGPTNTGKTHLAIERLCGHSSGMIGFPLRLLAREVYDRVCAIKGADRVALITGEERIEPPNARWCLCTIEAMPINRDMAFVALDEAQLCADRERGHIFTDRLLHARGREETMILGSATMEPMVKALLPKAEIVGRPRFSTLSHVGAKKLSRVPPRSAIVAFSAEQVYAVAELLRRFRGGAAVVMGALSPQTRNAQVALYQSGEVDYLVATDAIGMGLNLDLDHVAFAGLSKYDGQRQRRLTTSEMAQIAGRAGRHQRDGTFGTLSGSQHHDSEFTPEEVYAIEEHRFPPVTRLFWRDAEPRTDSLEHLIDDLSAPPERPELAPAPEAIDLAVMRRLAEDPAITGTVRGQASVARFREVCMLPDFRQQGVEVHARFVARLWEDLRRGTLPTDYVAARIADLDNPSGDIDTLQGRIAAIRSWSYIAQRPDWVLLREEMAARARAVEARLSDALHARLTERFVNRRLSVLMKGAGADSALLPVRREGENILVDGEPIGKLEGFRFKVDPDAHHGDHKLLFAAAERHLPQIFADRARQLAEEISAGTASPQFVAGAVVHQGEILARLERGKSVLSPILRLERALDAIPVVERKALGDALEAWFAKLLEPLEPLGRLDKASREEAGGPELRALLIRLVESGGVLPRQGSGLQSLGPDQRKALRRLGVTVGGLDIYLQKMLKPAPRILWNELALSRGERVVAVPEGMAGSIPDSRQPPIGYRRAGLRAIRVDLAERIIAMAFQKSQASGRKPFMLDNALQVSLGLSPDSAAGLLYQAGFRCRKPKDLPEGAFGPPTPPFWSWFPQRLDAGQEKRKSREGQGKKARPEDHPEDRPRKPGRAEAGERRPDRPRESGVTAPARASGAFAALADLLPPRQGDRS